MEELVKAIEMWASERGIFTEGTKEGQANKMLEEARELWNAVREENRIEVKDGIGDVFVTLVILSKMYGWDLRECVEYAYKQIKDRKGKMINGQFVKEE